MTIDYIGPRISLIKYLETIRVCDSKSIGGADELLHDTTQHLILLRLVAYGRSMQDVL